MRTLLGFAAGAAIGGYIGYRIDKAVQASSRSLEANRRDALDTGTGAIYGGVRDAASDPAEQQAREEDIRAKTNPSACAVCSSLIYRRQPEPANEETSPAG